MLLTSPRSGTLTVFAQNERSELAVDPDVDEEVGEVVDVHEVHEMSGQHQTRVESDEERRERGHAHQEQPCSDLYRLLVNAGLRLATTKFIERVAMKGLCM